MCEALARHVRSNNTTAKSEKKGHYGYDNDYKQLVLDSLNGRL